MRNRRGGGRREWRRTGRIWRKRLRGGSPAGNEERNPGRGTRGGTRERLRGFQRSLGEIREAREEDRDARGSMAGQPQPPQDRVEETDSQREARRQRSEELEVAEEAAQRERELMEISREADRATDDGNTDQVTDAAYDNHWGDPEYGDENMALKAAPTFGETVYHAKFIFPAGF